MTEDEETEALPSQLASAITSSGRSTRSSPSGIRTLANLGAVDDRGIRAARRRVIVLTVVAAVLGLPLVWLLLGLFHGIDFGSAGF